MSGRRVPIRSRGARSGLRGSVWRWVVPVVVLVVAVAIGAVVLAVTTNTNSDEDSPSAASGGMLESTTRAAMVAASPARSMRWSRLRCLACS